MKKLVTSVAATAMAILATFSMAGCEFVRDFLPTGSDNPPASSSSSSSGKTDIVDSSSGSGTNEEEKVALVTLHTPVTAGGTEMTLNIVFNDDGTIETSRTAGENTTALDNPLWSYGDKLGITSYTACEYTLTFEQDGSAKLHFAFKMSEDANPMMEADFVVTSEQLALLKESTPVTPPDGGETTDPDGGEVSDPTIVRTVISKTTTHAQAGTIYCNFNDMGIVYIGMYRAQYGLIKVSEASWTYENGTLITECWSDGNLTATKTETGYDISATHAILGTFSISFTTEELAGLVYDSTTGATGSNIVKATAPAGVAGNLDLVLRSAGGFSIYMGTIEVGSGMWSYDGTTLDVSAPWGASVYTATLNEDGTAKIHVAIKASPDEAPRMEVEFTLTAANLEYLRVCTPEQVTFPQA